MHFLDEDTQREALTGSTFTQILFGILTIFLCEASLTSHRKFCWVDSDGPCHASDSKDCKDEYVARYGSKQAE